MFFTIRRNNVNKIVNNYNELEFYKNKYNKEYVNDNEFQYQIFKNIDFLLLNNDPHDNQNENIIDDNAIIKTVLIHILCIIIIKIQQKNCFPFKHVKKEINPMVELNQRDLKKSKTFIKVTNWNLSNENIKINNSKDKKIIW